MKILPIYYANYSSVSNRALPNVPYSSETYQPLYIFSGNLCGYLAINYSRYCTRPCTAARCNRGTRFGFAASIAAYASAASGAVGRTRASIMTNRRGLRRMVISFSDVVPLRRHTDRSRLL